MDAAEIVIHVMQGNRSLQVFEFLRESVSQPRKSAHRHSHCEILAFDVARRNVIMVGISANDGSFGSHANGWAVARFRSIRNVSVDFLQHGKVDIVAERVGNGLYVNAVSICC